MACFGGNNTSGPIDVATARNASGSASGRVDFESETFAVCAAFAEAGHFGGMSEAHISDPIRADGASCGGGSEAICVTGPITHALKADGFDGSEDGTGRGQPIVYGSGVETTGYQGDKVYGSGDVGPCLASQGGNNGGGAGFLKHHAHQVRRLTPVECERLQGFPDSYTAIPWRKKPAEDCPDGPRYKALGNSMAVPVIRWIGARIEKALGGGQALRA